MRRYHHPAPPDGQPFAPFPALSPPVAADGNRPAPRRTTRRVRGYLKAQTKPPLHHPQRGSPWRARAMWRVRKRRPRLPPIPRRCAHQQIILDPQEWASPPDRAMATPVLFCHAADGFARPAARILVGWAAGGSNLAPPCRDGGRGSCGQGHMAIGKHPLLSIVSRETSDGTRVSRGTWGSAERPLAFGDAWAYDFTFSFAALRQSRQIANPQ